MGHIPCVRIAEALKQNINGDTGIAIGGLMQTNPCWGIPGNFHASWYMTSRNFMSDELDQDNVKESLWCTTASAVGVRLAVPDKVLVCQGQTTTVLSILCGLQCVAIDSSYLIHKLYMHAVRSETEAKSCGS